MRRAERGLALAVRASQEARRVHALREDPGPAPRYVPPRRYLGVGAAVTEAYAMSDGVSDERFERVLDECRAEGSLARVAVARKIRGGASTAPGRGHLPRGQASRRPLPDFAHQAAWRLRQDAERLARVTTDDRLPRHKQQVAAHARNHLLYTIQVCHDLLDRLTDTQGA
jgi:hypothetical protein